MRIKDDPDSLHHIPEVVGWPELIEFLAVLNADDSPIESVGCEKSFFPAVGKGKLSVQLGSYIDVIFTNAGLNDMPENVLFLANVLLEAVKGCEKWWSEVSCVLQPMRIVPGAKAPWGMMIRVTGYGRSQEEARKLWGETIARLKKVASTLPRDFRWYEANQTADKWK
jgi:hypothetical protein